MGAKASAEAEVATPYSSIVGDDRDRSHHHGGLIRVDPAHHPSHGAVGFRPRARSLSGAVQRGHPIVIASGAVGGGSPDTNDRRLGSDPRAPAATGTAQRRRLVVGSSVPLHLLALNGIKCPICSKFIPSDDVELHLVLCMTKPKLSYNDDVLAETRGECVICFDELNQGDTIARLPCLCIYHKRCIDDWFKVNRSCPEHPGD